MPIGKSVTATKPDQRKMAMSGPNAVAAGRSSTYQCERRLSLAEGTTPGHHPGQQRADQRRDRRLAQESGRHLAAGLADEGCEQRADGELEQRSVERGEKRDHLGVSGDWRSGRSR